MLCWRSGLGSIFGLENVRSRAASCTLWVPLVWASLTLVQPKNQKLNELSWGHLCEAGPSATPVCAGWCHVPLEKGIGNPNTGVWVLTLPRVINMSFLSLWSGKIDLAGRCKKIKDIRLSGKRCSELPRLGNACGILQNVLH